MKKLFLLLLTISSYADDLDLGDDFVAGEVVKAADFNTKFSLIEDQEAELTNSYFVGTWSCRGSSTNGFHNNATIINTDPFFGDINGNGLGVGTGSVTFSLDNDGYIAMTDNNILFTDDIASGKLHFEFGFLWDTLQEQHDKSRVEKVSSTKFFFEDRAGAVFTCTKS